MRAKQQTASHDQMSASSLANTCATSLPNGTAVTNGVKVEGDPQASEVAIDGDRASSAKMTAVNKRKRARPQKMSSADKVEVNSSTACSSDDSRSITNSTINTSADCPIDLSVLRSTSESVSERDLSNSEENLQPESAPDISDAGDECSREKNIERLQRNLTQEPAEDWEF